VHALRPLPSAAGAALQVGQTVVTIGNPYGLSKTLSAGVVSGLDRTIPAPTGTRIYGAIQVSELLKLCLLPPVTSTHSHCSKCQQPLAFVLPC
jgi:S1-C subfamily serine protease